MASVMLDEIPTTGDTDLDNVIGVAMITMQLVETIESSGTPEKEQLAAYLKMILAFTVDVRENMLEGRPELRSAWAAFQSWTIRKKAETSRLN